MKSYKFMLIASFAMVSISASAKKESFKVNGVCGMCETKIEKAAMDAGASFAEWNVDTKMLVVKFKKSKTSVEKIQKAIAAVGYDNAGVKATDEAYAKLHGCCKYERGTAGKDACCTGGKCTHGEENHGSHEGHDAKEVKDCCKDGKCSMPGHNGKDCCKKDADGKMACCKDGKCSMPGHDGKDCCKK